MDVGERRIAGESLPNLRSGRISEAEEQEPLARIGSICQLATPIQQRTRLAAARRREQADIVTLRTAKFLL